MTQSSAPPPSTTDLPVPRDKEVVFYSELKVGEVRDNYLKSVKSSFNH